MKFEGIINIENNEEVDIFPQTRKTNFKIITIGCKAGRLYIEYDNKKHYLEDVYELLVKGLK